MTPFEQQQDAIAHNLHLNLDGTTDAAFGYTPQSTEASYLDSYLAELRRRIEAGDHLQIRWLSKAYLSGGYDSPGEF